MKPISNKTQFPIPGYFYIRGFDRTVFSHTVVPCPRFNNQARKDYCDGPDCIRLKGKIAGNYYESDDAGQWACVIRWGEKCDR